MDVALYDIDSKMPNLALMKLSGWHKREKDQVEWLYPLKKYDKIYGSKIFQSSKYENLNNLELGGTGINLKKKLPLEIDICFPDYSIYPEFKDSIGFVTRGCIRNCEFCFVPEKEGKIHKYEDIEGIWRGKGNLTLFDNNILAMPEEFLKILQFCKEKKIKVDFNQGLDCRLVTKEIADIILRFKSQIKPYVRFAFDNLVYRRSVRKTVQLLGFECFWYVYCDENLDNAIERLMMLRQLKQKPYLMRNERVRGREFPKHNFLAHWCNYKGAFRTLDLIDYYQYYKKNKK